MELRTCTDPDANDEQIGNATVGYGGIPNWFPPDNGCSSWFFGSTPNASELESYGHQKGIPRGAVAMYDLQGNRLWYRYLLDGLCYGINTDGDGNILIAGGGAANSTFPDMPSVTMHFNGGEVISSGYPCPPQGTTIRVKPYLAKYDQAGNLLWLEVFGIDATLAGSWANGGEFYDVTNITYQGQPAYMAVGHCSSSATNMDQGFVVRVRADGTLIDKHAYAPNDPIWSGFGTNAFFPPIGDPNLYGQLRLTAVAKHPDLNQVSVSGSFRKAATYNGPPVQPEMHAFMMTMDQDAADPYAPGPGQFVSTYNEAAPLFIQGGYQSGHIHCTTGVEYVKKNGVVRTVWPVLANFPLQVDCPQNDFFAGKSIAYLKVHGFSGDGTTLQWTQDLGEVRAYDLQSEVCMTTDGDVAVLSTKWAPPYSYTGPAYGWNQLSNDQQACLSSEFSYDINGADAGGFVDWDHEVDPEPDGVSVEPIYAYWNTDAFVAKLNSETGDMLWCTQWDAEPQSPAACWPGDLKKQECMYKITEDQDGGLVVSGNTSHNFDDYYLAKLLPDCQSAVEYDETIATEVMNSPSRSYTVGTNEIWDTNKNIHGTIIIPAGHTLTINSGAVIRFADSHQLAHPTRVQVEPGGKLFVNGDAVLTSIAECPGSVWDGILVKGTNNSQDGNSFADQGYAYVREATIENARTAMITNNQFLDGDDLAAYQLQFAGGGVIRTRGATFRNNKRDVVMGPYENLAPNDPTEVRVNRSYFHDTRFIVDAPLADAHRPLEHISLYGVRNIPVLGCAFSGSYFQPDPDNSPLTVDAGKGIRALQSSFVVAPFCPVIVNYGEPCPTPVMPTFDRLLLAVEVADFTDDKTFSVDQATFTRCPRNIRMDGVRNPAITSNHFEVADFRDPFLYSTPYGIYSDECTGYEVEDNELLGDLTTSRAQSGIVIKNSGREANRIYNNKLDAFGYKNSTALLIQGENADAGDDYFTGLDIKCNDFGQTGNKNAYDVALTAGDPTVRGTQGATFGAPDDFIAPAGNRFSLLGATESDWHVANSSNFVVYYHHNENGGTPAWEPQDFAALYLDPEDAGGDAPNNWNEACPSNQRSRERQRSGMMAGSEENSEDLEASKNSYDATVDNGDTYSLLSYVGDPTKSSTQVRNALQSVAPKVSLDVWQAAFERNPAMNPWNLTQALLSNSPLQPEVMKLCYESDLSDFYYNLVASAQSGINPLSILESDISTYASGKAEDLTDLGRWSWLDSTNVDSMIFLLKTWHDELPADNGDAVLAGYYSAKGDHAALYDLAAVLEATSDMPYVYGLLKRYASAEQGEGWTKPDMATSTYLSELAQNRWDLGSAKAGAWLEALGADPLEEVVILPVEERAMVARKRVRNTASNEAIILEAYPNPTEGIAYVVCNVPEGVEYALVRVHDLNGRLLTERRITAGSAMVELNLAGEPSGVYAAELALDGVRFGTVKITVR